MLGNVLDNAFEVSPQAGAGGCAGSDLLLMEVSDRGPLLEQVGMAAQAQRPCGVLAYGDVKRVELAIALANRPRLLLMDEPTAGMAPKERNELMALTKRLVLEKNMSVSSPSTAWMWCLPLPTA
jgi:ABC-type molybdenum transport system ATPase subunit/photorepair protein PhrA